MKNALPANDRSIQFGDGCFTTLHIKDRDISLLDAHLQRLQKACSVLSIPFTTWDLLRMEIKKLAKNYTEDEGVLKVVISRGRGKNYGYSAKNCLYPTRILSISTYPPHYALWRKEGITLTLSPIKLGRNPILAGLKHLNRLEQVLIRTYLDEIHADEAIVLDSEGYIIECCAANLFWRIGKQVFTPSLNQAGVNGVMRQFFLKSLEDSHFDISEVNVRLEALYDAEEVIICNSLLPVAPVLAYKDQLWLKGELYQFLTSLSR